MDKLNPLPSLKKGDIIDFQYTVGGTKKKLLLKTGSILQITSKFITVNTGKYPESISHYDIQTGKTKITTVNGKSVQKGGPL